MASNRMIKFKSVLVGLATNLPGVYRFFSRTGGTDSARYCYSIWLRHLVLAHQHGLTAGVPQVVAELGPGDSLGIGLAALLSGAEQYYALDLVRYASAAKNLAILDELVNLFQRRADLPGDEELFLHNLRLESYAFPRDILTDQHLEYGTSPERIQTIRNALSQAGNEQSQPSCISYIVPWNDSNTLAASSVDMIYSQAVLEHVDDLDGTYQALQHWLKPGGFMSHTIDFDCHSTASKWNGHWGYPDSLWKIIRGRRSYLINRQPYSAHIALLERHGFSVVYEKKRIDESGIKRDELAPRYNLLTDEDLRTRSALMQARKR